jgi:alanine racemase
LARIELSKSAFFHNLTLLSEKLGGKDKLAIVLKDNAYGHGLMPMAKLSHEFGLETAIVRTYKEAEAIKTFFKKIVILNPRTPHIIEKNYSLVVNSIAQLQTIPDTAKIELKIDTGMHRNGICSREIDKAFVLIKQKNLSLEGVLTHFRSADEMGSELFWQIQNWKKIKNQIALLCKKHNLRRPLFHSANSAATLRLSKFEDSFARCGIAAYGYHELPPVFGKFDLQPVLKLYAEKIATIHVSKGERIGYGGTFTAPYDMTVSTYDIGYGDGFLRFNGKGKFILSGKQVLGKISMDSLAVEGSKEEICLIGNAKEIANYFQTISYDILVKLNSEIPRIITH